ncbi:small ribosomal subunit Rsm22 family protein [Actomonas aquatica]|uniref:Small ribosomal subunit Rsm22 family protein n=1 Tax=Actomonas aquatica TaxID=2866162 RepID=A0ABZ1CBT3_9BACT|nr:small ribosomal subunit Rsm22 family protein [Opitutus sp. WL0086]WRQ88906.1 small ribosomal subunit Rsm22 family protein [Opitutus sp. WL0086]
MTWDELDWSILDRLRDGFLSGGAAAGPYWQSHDDLAHYDHTYAERIGWKWDHVLGELQRRGWTPPPGHLLDWGCGSGIATRRVLAHWPDAVSPDHAAHFFDHSTLAESFAQSRLRETHPNIAAQSWDRSAAPLGTVLISHVLNELDEDSATELRETLAHASAVIWVEPGTSTVAGQLVRWRENLLPDFRVLYPCPHQGACGMLAPGNARHWCHHFAPPPPWIFGDSNWVKFGQGAGIDLRSLPYSALVLERADRPATAAPLPSDAGRIIGRPERFKPYARLLGCDTTGLPELTLPKRSHAHLIKRLDRADAPRLFRWQHDGSTISRAEPLHPASET